ncbi:MAG: rod shape-determining protein MreC [Deltaproteobacteria bacterium]|nr:rod shape-determining protein MreC [Deltaproteobacteria bacterium]
MFSKRLLSIVCLILIFLINIIFLSVGTKHRHTDSLIAGIVMAAVSPFQEGITRSVVFLEDLWRHYFYLVSVGRQNDALSRELAQAKMQNSRYVESAKTCERLRRLLEIKTALPQKTLFAEVVGRDPSGWFQAIVINRGTGDGVAKGMPVIAPDGIVGQVVIASYDYSKVMLMIDRSSAIDALVQRNRARGIVAGEADALCRFKYVLRKADVRVGDVIVSSGLDGLFPKGLRLGTVAKVTRERPGIFQDVRVKPFVDFDTLEEVLIILPS